MRRRSVSTLGVCAAIALAAALAAGGCGSGVRRLQVARPAAAALPTTPPGPETARVIFVRPAAGGGNYAISVWEGETLHAWLRGGQIAYADLAPGKHVFLGVAENADVVEADLAGGRTYFVHLRFNSYYMGTSVHLDPVFPGHENWELVQGWVEKAQLMEVIPEAAARWTAAYAADNRERMQRYEARPADKRKYITAENGV